MGLLSSVAAGLLSPLALTSRLFAHLQVDDESRAAVQAAAARGPVVFVLRGVSALDALAAAHLVEDWGVPPIGFAHDLAALPTALIAKRRGDLGDGSRAALARTLARGESAILFLKRPASLFSTTGRARSDGDELLSTLFDLARAGGREVSLVPLAFLWSPRRESLTPSTVDAIFGPTDMPGDLRALAQLALSYQSCAARVGAPIDVRAFLENQPADTPDYTLVRRLTYALLRKVERERRAALGPVRKGPDRVRDEVLRSPKLAAMIHDLSQGDEAKRVEIVAKAREMLNGLAAAPDPDMLRAIEPVADRLVHRVFAEVEVDPAEVLRVRDAARDGTIVLLPSHKSHVDYLVLSYVLRKNLLELPVIAAGDNLSFFPVGELLRRGGAFFIRRDFRGDRLYAAVVDAYVRRLLKDGWALEFFLEGGRSRTGKLLEPKLGLLNLVVDCALSSGDSPLFFVPVHIGYDRLMEDFELAQERAGAKKERESARSLAAVADAMKYDYGKVTVSFGAPIELTELAREVIGARGGAELSGAQISPAKRRAVTHRLAGLVTHGILASARISAGGLVAMVLLDASTRGVTHPDLVAKATQLLTVMVRAGARPVADLVAPSGAVRDAAVREAAVLFQRAGLLREHSSDATLGRSGTAPKPRDPARLVYTVPEEARARLELTKNGILHHVADRGLLSLVVRAASTRAIAREALFTEALALGKLLAHDAIQLGDGLSARLDDVLADMIAFGELAERDGAITLGPGNDVAPSAAWVAMHASHWLATLEAYRIAARALRVLAEGPKDGAELSKRALEIGHEMFLGTEIDRREALCATTLGSAFAAFGEAGWLKRGREKHELAEGKTEDELVELEAYFARYARGSSGAAT